MRIWTQAEQYATRIAALTDEDKAELVRQFREDGGYTFRNRPGDGPTDGFMVSLPGAEEISPADEFTGDKAEDYRQRHQDFINEDENNYIGNWNDRDHNDAYQDVSRNFSDLWEAVEQGYGRNDAEAQHGIYHIPSGITFSPLEFSYNGQPGFMMAGRQR